MDYELVERLAQLPLPYDVLSACGHKAMAMAAELHTLGVDPADMRILRSYIPDSSAAGLRTAYEQGEGAIMYTPPRDCPSFTERLAKKVGVVDLAAASVEFAGARFSQSPDDPARIVVTQAEPSDGEQPAWHVHDPREKMTFANHIDLMVGREVVDPAYDKGGTLSPGDWKSFQNFMGTVILSHGITDTNPTMHLHTQLLSNHNRKRYAAILAEQGVPITPTHDFQLFSKEIESNPELYKSIMGSFLNLQIEDPQDINPDDPYQKPSRAY
ncbi:MAG TPA: hypothetical protein VJR27_01740 [Candidatus Saccharimonadales bacterium]|nr:hypothetical protein [Candidatus Saccharimonadales bacterium]